MNSEFAQIYDYQSPKQFLLDRVSSIQKQDPSVSIRGLATKMGLKSHALLLMLLQGKRPLRVKHATPIAKGLGLSSQERLYLQALIQFDSALDLEEKRLCGLWLSNLHPEHTVASRQIDHFELVSNWIHMALLSLCETHDFDPAPEAIARRFGGRVSSTEVRAAIERLRSLELITFNASNGSFKPSQHQVCTPDDVASQGVRKYHKEVMRLAHDALERVPLNQREFQSFAISIPAAKASLAKEMIRKFRQQFGKAMGSEPGDEVYQFNLQFFQLTESREGPRKARPSQDEGVDSETTPQTLSGEIVC